MIFNNLFNSSDIIGQAMNASILRNDVIINNIANADVPGFKKSVVEFESYLSNELEKAENKGGIVNFNNIQPSIHISNETFSHRLDGNNVDIEMEMVSLVQNNTRYDVMANSMMNNYRRINTVINSNI